MNIYMNVNTFMQHANALLCRLLGWPACNVDRQVAKGGRARRGRGSVHEQSEALVVVTSDQETAGIVVLE